MGNDDLELTASGDAPSLAAASRSRGPGPIGQMMDWQPIETAPKDGSVILIVDMTDHYPKAEAAAWWPERDARYPWTLFEGNNGGDGLNARDAKYPPTHWMPLPSPPEVTP